MLQLVGRLLDVAQDAGAKVGPQNNMNSYYYYRYGHEPRIGLGAVRPRRFRQGSGRSLREGDRRRARSGRAAGAAEQGRAGPIVAIREVAVPGDKPAMDDRPHSTADESPQKRLETAKFQDVPVRVELLVRFEVHPSARRREEEVHRHEQCLQNVQQLDLAPRMVSTRRSFLERCRTSAPPPRASRPPAGCRASIASAAAQKEVLPKHVTPETIRAVTKGLDYLAAQQADEGSWITGGGQAYPVAMTGLAGTAFLAHGDSPTRGKYSKNVQGAVEYLVRCATPTGLITGPNQDSGHADARPWLRASVPGVGLRHDHARSRCARRCRRRSARRSRSPARARVRKGAGPIRPARATKDR